MCQDLNGVVDYPIAKGMPLTGIWKYTPNVQGPSITTEQDTLRIQRGSVQNTNQTTYLQIQQNIATQGGVALQFDITFDTLQNNSEVKLGLFTDFLALRYNYPNDGTSLYYSAYNNSSNRWDKLGRSQIIIGDKHYYTVLLYVCSTGVMIFENGVYIGQRITTIPTSFNPVFNWQILSPQGILNAAIKNIYVIPNVFAPGMNTPWDVAFAVTSVPTPDQWRINNDTLPVSFGESWMRVSTSKMSTSNAMTITNLQLSLPSFGVAMYRMRVNAADGTDTKVQVLGANFLRIQSGSVSWQANNGGIWTKIGDSGIKVGTQQWTTVTLIYSASMVTLYEDGVYRFARSYQGGQTWLGIFEVEHSGINTAVSVDLSNFRALPLGKQNTMLALDMVPSSLFYYPLKSDFSEAIIQDPILNLTPVNSFVPKYAPGLFGLALSFTNSQGALSMPTLPYGRTFPSYTLCLWTYVNSYPPSGLSTGLVGPLSLRGDGKMDYAFAYSGQEPLMSTTYTSSGIVPKSQWVSIILTYGYEESRLVIYINGSVDSVFYTSANNASRAAIIPTNGYIGSKSFGAPGKVLPLDGMIGDIQVFEQCFHGPTAAAFASRQGTSLSLETTQGQNEVEVFPIPLLIAAAAISYGPIYAWWNSKQSAGNQLTVDEVVKRIVAKIGNPAGVGAKISRADINVPDDFPITLDVFGTGTGTQGIVRGFQHSINVNDISTFPDFVIEGLSNPIPSLIRVQPWNTNPILPFADRFADRIMCSSNRITPSLVKEFARVIKPLGIVEVWTPSYGSTIDDATLKLMASLGVVLNAPPGRPAQLDRFVQNGTDWLTRWRFKCYYPKVPGQNLLVAGDTLEEESGEVVTLEKSGMVVETEEIF